MFWLFVYQIIWTCYIVLLEWSIKKVFLLLQGLKWTFYLYLIFHLKKGWSIRQLFKLIYFQNYLDTIALKVLLVTLSPPWKKLSVVSSLTCNWSASEMKLDFWREKSTTELYWYQPYLNLVHKQQSSRHSRAKFALR